MQQSLISRNDEMPRKPRLVDGLELPPNLYQHERKTPGKWRYLRPDGTPHRFEASTADAIAAAETLNHEFAAGAELKPAPAPKPGRLSFARHIEEFIEATERRDPGLIKKTSWRNYKGYLRHFAKSFTNRPIPHITIIEIQAWWDELSGNAQRSRKAILRKFFSHLISHKLCPQLDANPFTNDDSLPQLAMRPRPARSRLRLSLGDFWKIHAAASSLGYTFLQVAMEISLITTLRRGDICELTLEEHVIGNILRKQISKSHAQLSQAEFKATPSNLSWNLDNQPRLREIINQAREISLQHRRCPYLVSHRFDRRQKNANRKHTHQVFPDYLTRAFAEARDATELFNGIPAASRPSFHEIRSLSSHLYKKAGYQATEVQVLMAHTDEKITMHYQAGHETQWTEIDMILPESFLEGSAE